MFAFNKYNINSLDVSVPSMKSDITCPARKISDFESAFSSTCIKICRMSLV